MKIRKAAILFWQESSYHWIKLWYWMIISLLVFEQWSKSRSSWVRLRFIDWDWSSVPILGNCGSLRFIRGQAIMGDGNRCNRKVWRSWHLDQLCWSNFRRGHRKYISVRLRLYDGHQLMTAFSPFKHFLSFSWKVFWLYCKCGLHAWIDSKSRYYFLQHYKSWFRNVNKSFSYGVCSIRYLSKCCRSCSLWN